MGIRMEVVRKEVTTEVKKLGLLYDLQTFIQLRRHDTLIFYITKGD